MSIYRSLPYIARTLQSKICPNVRMERF